MTTLSHLFSQEAAKLVIFTAFVYGFFFRSKPFDCSDLVVHPLTSTLFRSIKAILYHLGADLITGLFPITIPFLGLALLGSAIYYFSIQD